MSTFDNKMLDGSNMMMEAVNAIRAKSDARRDIEVRVLAENGLGSKNQLFAASLTKFNNIVDTLVENKDSDISLKIFDAQEGIEEVAKDARFTPRQLDEGFWDSRKKTSGPTKTPFTRQDAYPEKNSTFTGAPKETKNKGGFSGGATAVTKGPVTMMKRNRLKEEDDLQEVTYSKSQPKTQAKEDEYSERAYQRRKEDGTGSKKAKAEVHVRAATTGHPKLAADLIKKRNAYWKEKEARGEYGAGVSGSRHMNRKWATMNRHGEDRLKAAQQKKNEDLQELSKKTLGSYIKKASNDITVKGAATREFANRSREDYKKDNFVGARKNNEMSDKIFAKSWNRRQNMAKAVDRLTKEDTDLQELSRKTLGSYVKKAAPEVDIHSAKNITHLERASDARKSQNDLISKRKKTGADVINYKNAKGDEDYHNDKANHHIFKTNNRVKGIQRAADRLTKEEVSVEAYAEEIINTILAMEGLEIDQLTESGLAKMEAIAEQVMMDEGYDLQEISKDLASRALDKATDYSSRSDRAKGHGGKGGNHFSNRFADHDLGYKFRTPGDTTDEYATKTARRLAGHIIKKFRKPGADIVKANRADYSSTIHKAPKPARGAAAAKPALAQRAVSGAKKFLGMREEIVEAILAMEGLDSIDQLTESGLAKMEAIVEQVMAEVIDPHLLSMIHTLTPVSAAAGIGLAHAGMKAHEWVKGKIADHRRKKANAEFRKKNPHYYEPGGVFHGRKDD